MTTHRILAALLCALGLAACEKNAVQVLPITNTIPNGRVKFFNFGVNAPGVNFYAGTTKMTAILTGAGQEATTGVVYGGAGNGGVYLAITPGAYTLTGRIAATVDKDLAVATVNVYAPGVMARYTPPLPAPPYATPVVASCPAPVRIAVIFVLPA